MNDVEFAVNSDLENLRNWLMVNKLSLNVAKIEFMLIGCKPTISIYTTCYIVFVHTYCCEVWDVLGETQSKQLQKLQNRAARIIMNMSNDVDYSIALHALGWETLKLMRKKENQNLCTKL